ncbi:MAG: hypothetical protein HYT97_00280 [Elusimicrobia bacterium]|nr:hypothetical protein [Elusimicrobiota bacterium]
MKKKTKRLPLIASKAIKAMRSAVAEVVEEHRRLGIPLAVWRNGKVVLQQP